MKTKSPFLFASLFSVFALTAATAADASKPDPSAPPAPTLTEPEALKKSAVSAPHYPAHPSTSPQAAPSGDGPVAHTGASTFGENTDPNIISTPPPAARSETKPPSPVAGYVWVPGHYAPMKGQWQWVPGEWGVPATPSSVWIEGRYDEKARRYSPGYWQPDRPPAPQNNGNNLVKEPAVAAPGGY